MDVPVLAQRGRASLDFLAGMGKVSSGLSKAMEAEMAERQITADTLPDDYDARLALVERALADSPVYKARQLLGEFGAKAHGRFCQEAFEEIRDDLAPRLLALDDGPTTLTVPDDFEQPAYFSDVWFHRTHGGWDAGDFNGYVHGELIHKMLVARSYPGDIFASRRNAAKLGRNADYKRILEIGTSSGHYTLGLAEAFPDAEIVGIDPSPRMLEHARRVANERGYAWKLHVGLGEDTGFDDARFDLVTSFIVLHELPAKIIRAMLEEAYRLLEPGGEILMVDVPRYQQIDKMASWRYEYLAKWGGEPYWRESASMDLVGALGEIGFEDVDAFTMPPTHMMYVVRGRKPA